MGMRVFNLFIIFSLNFKVSSSCWPFVYPEATPDECCEEKIFGNDHYYYYDYQNTSKYGCDTSCVYTKLGEPDSQYCFKRGGETHGSCNDELCDSDVFDEQTEWTYNNLEIDIKKMREHVDVSNLAAGQLASYSQALNYSYHNLKINILTPAMQQVRINANPCSNVRKECDRCYNGIQFPIFHCIITKNKDACLETLMLSNATCLSCICEVIKTCNATFPCPTDKQKPKAGGLLPVQYISTDTKSHRQTTDVCDRKCDGLPKRCVVNLTLEEQGNTEGENYMVDGGDRPVLTYNKQIPGPTISICQGDDLVVHLTNSLSVKNTTLHFHGVRQRETPWADGVAWVSQYPTPPNEVFIYEFNATNYDDALTGSYTQPGTYWYHSHVGNQRKNGAYGALIIKPTVTNADDRYDVDDSDNIIILQEWYDKDENGSLVSLLVNGHGKRDSNSRSKYMKYNVEPNKKVLFRVIGAISENVPLRLSIEDHTFTAIATDSQNIESVPNIDELWIAGGERFDIVINTKESNYLDKYEIKVFGYEDPNDENSRKFCTIAWLIYNKDAEIGNNFVQDCFTSTTGTKRTLNPIPNNYPRWKERLSFNDAIDGTKDGDIFIDALRAEQNLATLNIFSNSDIGTSIVDTKVDSSKYIVLENHSFNNYLMDWPKQPFLLQPSLSQENLCGSECDMDVTVPVDLQAALEEKYLSVVCKRNTPQCENKIPCKCHHVIQYPYAPGYWTDIILINKDSTNHPIHQHGGWFWVLGMGKYDQSIDRDFIMQRDKMLPRNFESAPAKDTIQVPSNGYVILRTPMDNRGVWAFHCHINKHFKEGMALVLQIGKESGAKKTYDQEWCPKRTLI